MGLVPKTYLKYTHVSILSEITNMANFSTLLFCLATVLVAQQTSAFLDDKCMLDTDCPGGCCALKRDGNVCQKFGVVGSICDLEGQGLAKDACACSTGLKCTGNWTSDPNIAVIDKLGEMF